MSSFGIVFPGCTSFKSINGSCRDVVYCIPVLAPTQMGKSLLIQSLYGLTTGKSAGLQVGRGTTSCTQRNVVLEPFLAQFFKYADPKDAVLQELGVSSKPYQRIVKEHSEVEEVLCQYNRRVKCTMPDDVEKRRMSDREVSALTQFRKTLRVSMSQSSYSAKVEIDRPVQLAVGGSHDDQQMYLRFIDTPGLEDTQGQDDIIMADILQTLAGAGNEDVKALIFVVRQGVPWTGKFLEVAKRYWEQFPNFRANWIFVHTNMNPFQMEAYTSGRTFEEDAEMRKASLISELAKAFGADPSDLSRCDHIFIENKGLIHEEPEEGEFGAIQELQKMEQAKSFNKLLSAIARCPPVSLSAIDYLKPEDVRSKDRQMSSIVSLKKEQVGEDAQRRASDDMRVALSELAEINAMKMEAEEQKHRLWAQIDQLDHDGPWELKSKVAEKSGKWFAWNRDTQELSVNGHSPEKVKSQSNSLPGYWFASMHDQPLEENGTDRVAWRPTLWSPPFCSYGYELKLFCESRDHHAATLRALRSQIDSFDSQINQYTRRTDAIQVQEEDQCQQLKIMKAQCLALDNLHVDLLETRKNLFNWCKPGGYGEFYRWFQGKRDEVEALKKYSDIMGLGQIHVDAIQGLE